MTRSRGSSLLALVPALALVVGACASPADGGRTAPALAPPPLRADPPLTRDDALALIAGAAAPEDAIRALDDRRLGFPLDAAAIEWFRRREAPPEVIDYLLKRAAVPWEHLRGDVDPERPETSEYVDPRRGDEDFAGTDARLLFSSLKSLNPFQSRKPAPVDDDAR